MRNRHKLLWIPFVIALLIGGFADRVIADSPPNITQDIAWFGDPDSFGLSEAYDSVEDIETAFNHGRRQEEIQLSLPTNILGTIDLPEQAVWDALTMQQKALILINEERTARHEMRSNVIGLPLAGIQNNVNQLAQQYAQLLVDANDFAHTVPWPNAPEIDDPFERIENTSVVGDCNEPLSYVENLAAFWTTADSIPLPIERSIYLWIYADAGSAWGHREALLLQDADLGLNGEFGGFANNIGSDAHEGFLGFGRVGSAEYDRGEERWNWGEAVVMEMFDPIADEGCPTSAGRSAMSATIQRTSPAIVAVGSPVSFALQLSNSGDTLLTAVDLINAADPALLQFVGASTLAVQQPTAPAQPIPTTQIVVDGEDNTVTLADLETLLPHDVLNPIQQISLSLNYIAASQTATAQSKLSALAQGGWGGSLSTDSASDSVQIVAPIINEIDHLLFANPNDDAPIATAEFIELKNPSSIEINLGAYQILLVQQADGVEEASAVYRTIALPNATVAAEEYFVLCTDPELVANCDHTIPADAADESDNLISDNLIRNDRAGAVALVYGETILDALSYGGASVTPYVEGESSSAADDAETVQIGLSRFPDGSDTDSNLADWSRRCATPGRANTEQANLCGPNLRVEITVEPQVVAPGAPIAYTIQYVNTGFSVGRDANLIAQLPQELSSFTIVESSGPIDLSQNPSGIMGRVDLLAVDQGGTIEISGTVALDLAAGTQLTTTSVLIHAQPNNIEDDETDSAAVTVINVAPIGVNDETEVDEDGNATPALLANDSDDNGDPLSIRSAYTSGIAVDDLLVNTRGLVQFEDDIVTYSPGTAFRFLAADETDIDYFGYVVVDSGGLTDTATVAVQIFGENDPPMAASDRYTATADSQLFIAESDGVLRNDTDPDSSDVLVVSESATVSPFGAAVAIEPNGQLIYDPTGDILAMRSLAAGQTAVDSFAYTITDQNDDASGSSSTASISVTVIGVNDAPQATADQYATDEDTMITIDTPGLLVNDSDVDQDDQLSIIVEEIASQYETEITIDADGTLLVDPTASSTAQALSVGESITESYTYTVQDLAGATAQSAFTITVNGINDLPIAVADTVRVYRENTLLIDVLANDSDPDQRDTLEILEINSEDLLGSISLSEDGIEYDPTTSPALQALDDDEFEVETFTYTITDQNNDPATGAPTRVEATVTITVAGGNNEPIAQDDLLEMDEDTILIIEPLINDSDPDLGDSIRLQSATDPTHGFTFVPEEENTVTYTPRVDFFGIDQFQYTVVDTNGLTATATVTVTVLPVNDAPEFVAAEAIPDVNAGQPFSTTVRATDVDQTDTLTVSSLQLPAWLQLTDHGDGSATLNGVPTNTDAGPQTVSLEVSDGLIAIPKTISFNVVAVEILPTETPQPQSTPTPNATPNNSPTTDSFPVTQPTDPATPAPSVTTAPNTTPNTAPNTTPTSNPTSQPSQTPVPSSSPSTPTLPETPTAPPSGQQDESVHLPYVERN